MRIDAHIHLYDTERPEGVPWPPRNQPVLYRPNLIGHFRQIRAGTVLTHAIVVEASELISDNDWLLEHVRDCPEVLGIIGSLDPRVPGFSTDLSRLAANPKFLGIRPRFHPAPSLREPAVAAALGQLATHGLTLEFNLPQYPMADVAAFARAHPDLRIVINHLAGARLRDGKIPQVWADGLTSFRDLANVSCKLSAFYHASGEKPAPRDPQAYVGILDHILDVFGPERVFFGSNWPVSDLGGDYASMPEILVSYIARREDLTMDAVFRTSTLRAYGLSADAGGGPGED
jgi:L-fuconolactonase